MERMERVPEPDPDAAEGGRRGVRRNRVSMGGLSAQTHRISAPDRGHEHAETLDPPSSVGLITARQDQFLLDAFIVGGGQLKGIGLRARIGLDRDLHEAECALDLALGVAGESERLGCEGRGHVFVGAVCRRVPALTAAPPSL